MGTYIFWYHFLPMTPKNEAIKCTSPNGTVVSQFQYDNMGNMVRENSDSATKEYTYDGAGRLTNFTLTYSDKLLQSADYTYDVLGRMTSAADGYDNVAYEYDPNGSLVKSNKGQMGTYIFWYHFLPMTPKK